MNGSNFNSILVRLKPDSSDNIVLDTIEFQFHSGTIKARTYPCQLHMV